MDKTGGNLIIIPDDSKKDKMIVASDLSDKTRAKIATITSPKQ